MFILRGMWSVLVPAFSLALAGPPVATAAVPAGVALDLSMSTGMRGAEASQDAPPPPPSVTPPTPTDARDGDGRGAEGGDVGDQTADGEVPDSAAMAGASATTEDAAETASASESVTSEGSVMSREPEVSPPPGPNGYDPIDLEDTLDPYGRYPSHASRPGRGWKITGYVLGAVGTGLAVTSVTYLGLSVSAKGKIKNGEVDSLEERAELLRDISNYQDQAVLFGAAGGGTLAVATICYLVGQRRLNQVERRSAWRMGPSRPAGGWGMQLEGRF